jgi:hypothetical protein
LFFNLTFSQTSDHPPKDLAKFVYRPGTKVKYFNILATYWNLLLKSGELGPLPSQCICTQPPPQVQIWLNLGPKNATKFGSLTSPGVGFFFQFCGFKSLVKFSKF